MMNEITERERIILDAIFNNIIDPIAICRIVESEDGTHKDVEYVRVNDAYEQINGIRREELIGRRYSAVWANDKEDWGGMMIRVVETGSTEPHPVDNPRKKSGFFEGESSMASGFYQLFTFSPIEGWIVLIFRDMDKWHKIAISLKKKEKLLRQLTSKLILAEEKTRRNIATTLHDGIGYSLVSMLNTLRGLEEKTSEPGDKSSVRETIDEMEKLIQETRSFTFDISPPALYEIGLGAAVETRCEHLKTRHGLNYIFKTEGTEPKLDENTRIFIYQMIHELLVNVVKHAQATSVLVKIRWGKKKIQIVVEDNGIGFAKDAKNKNNGMGIFSIKERLRSYNGHMNIVSEAGKGTTVSMIVPFQIKNDESDDTHILS